MTTQPDITFENIYKRLIAQLPPWFGNQQYVAPPVSEKTPTTNFNNLLWAFITTAYNSYLQLQYDFLQLRIGAYEISNDPNWPAISIPPQYPFDPQSPTTYFPILPVFPENPIAFGDNLDLIAQDFFGTALTRKPDETDATFRTRILSNVMRVKATRPAMLDALINLVTPAFQQAGIPVVEPYIYEYFSQADNGGYNDYEVLAYGTPSGSNGAGAYGSGSYPYQCIIVVFLPQGNGLATYPGYLTVGESIDWGAGFGDPSIDESTPPSDIPPQWYGSDSLINHYITEADIVNLVNLMKVLGTKCNIVINYV